MSQGGNDNGMENFLLKCLGVLFAVAVVVWITGFLSAVLSGSGSFSTPITDMPAVVAALAQDPSHPNMAFKADSQAVPGPFAFYAVFILLIAAVVAAGIGIHHLVKGGGGKNALGHKGTQWAKRGDLKPLIVREPLSGRLTLGSVGNTIIATEQRHSVIVLGPTQSGKTTGLAVPAILEWDGPVIATSVKNDLAENTLEWRKRMGQV